MAPNDTVPDIVVSPPRRGSVSDPRQGERRSRRSSLASTISGDEQTAQSSQPPAVSSATREPDVKTGERRRRSSVVARESMAGAQGASMSSQAAPSNTQNEIPLENTYQQNIFLFCLHSWPF